jgi:AAA+ superfamily predicted ATPase
MFADRIDKRLTKAFGRAELDRFQVSRKELPSYRYVDLHRAIQSFLGDHPLVSSIVSENNEPLHQIIHEDALSWANRKVTRSPNTPWPIGPGEEEYLPTGVFWLCAIRRGSGRPQGLIRLSFNPFSEHAILEIASSLNEWVASAMAWILDHSVSESMYRNATLEIAYESAVKDEYGDVERQEKLRVLFKEIKPVTDDDLIVDSTTLRTLRRNVIDLHTRRDVLKAHGVPIRRGVLLYGPPGTGKTFACRYVCAQLEGVTKIMVTGSALHQVNAIFRLARMLQPSLLILEDVDLVFASREINLYSSVLGDLLDQMDGLRPFEDVGFILTTNAIERMEAAIKDRPGRVSQLIHFGPPHPDLRHRYLSRYLRDYEPLTFDIDDLVDRSEGTTQAFLKEWVHRAVQIATERVGASDQALSLALSDFDEAMAEMKEFAEGTTGSILGFHGK